MSKHDDEQDRDYGVVISGNTGPIALNGDINQNTTVVTGDGLTIVAGDNEKPISKTFGGKDGKKRRR